jgi:hypothetical protein
MPLSNLAASSVAADDLPAGDQAQQQRGALRRGVISLLGGVQYARLGGELRDLPGWHALRQAAGIGEPLQPSAGQPRSAYDRLKQPAKAATLTKFEQHLTHLAWLDGLGPARAWLAGIPPPKVAQFAGEAHVTDVANLRKMGPARRLALVVCLLHQAQVRARDEVATMFCKRMAAITKKTKEPACPARGPATPLVISWDFGSV